MGRGFRDAGQIADFRRAPRAGKEVMSGKARRSEAQGIMLGSFHQTSKEVRTMTTSGSEFIKIRIGTTDGKIKKIKDENHNAPTHVDPKDVPKIEKGGTLIAKVYRYQFNPVCTVVIRSDGTAVKICR
jgi:hypothetical protein